MMRSSNEYSRATGDANPAPAGRTAVPGFNEHDGWVSTIVDDRTPDSYGGQQYDVWRSGSEP